MAKFVYHSGVDIHHLDVVITNALVALLGFSFGFSLLQSPTMHYDLRRLLVGCFLAVGLASGIAGYFHGFLQDGSDPLRPVVWRAVVLTSGLASYYLWKLTFFFALPQRFRKLSDALGIVALIGYCYVVTNVRDDFFVVVAFYLPAVVLLLLTLTVKWLGKRDARYFAGVLGLTITLVAAGVQFSKFTLHEEYLTHNAIYHLVQAVGLYYFYQFSRRIIVWTS